MEGMVLVSKVNGAAGLGGSGRGRPKRTNFCMRRYGKVYKLSIPNGVSDGSDRIHFFLSPDGFAISITPNGERAISGGATNHTATIPRIIGKHMYNTKRGVTELICTEYQNRTWFFPFSQFSSAEALHHSGDPLAVDHPTTLME